MPKLSLLNMIFDASQMNVRAGHRLRVYRKHKSVLFEKCVAVYVLNTLPDHILCHPGERASGVCVRMCGRLAQSDKHSFCARQLQRPDTTHSHHTTTVRLLRVRGASLRAALTLIDYLAGRACVRTRQCID